MAKTVAIPARPKKQAAAVESWVNGGSASASDNGDEKKVRLTIDLPSELHQRVMTGCVRERTKATKVIRQLLETRFPRGAR